ncbi:RRP15-like protein isoform X2 [Xenia sp. Carnegie-2017]|uniref:RRP15-like protein isoform X2 n=1 Tax=Xenia sp. Carnegie-2017 TaxID=2897299 RepID=UPI001F04EC5A|nr:RRP15-like protein isoform X2 [Xenia sp. Carnegie-2017]
MATTAVQEKHVEHGANNPINYENKNSNEDDIKSGTKDGNPGWADAMARILTKQIPEDKPVVLSKYKKVETERKQKQEEILKQKLITQEKHEAREKNHVKPAPSNDEKERNLKRIATKGVVKLFNAVNKHQEDLDVKLKSAPTEAKKVKVMKSVSKSSFLDMLKHDSSDVTPSHQQAFPPLFCRNIFYLAIEETLCLAGEHGTKW